MICDATIPGPSNITVEITGPSNSTGSLGQSTVPQGNDVFRSILVFPTVTASDSGEYVCSVLLVGGPAEVTESTTAVLDAGTYILCI
jgi:hypothetical protein